MRKLIKTLAITTMLLIAGAMMVMSGSNSYNWVRQDYCYAGNCSGSLYVPGNLTVIGDYINLTVVNYNVTGNISADYYLGNGSFLTDVSTTTIGNCSISGSCPAVVYDGDDERVTIQYENITNLPTCGGTDKLTYDGTTLSCEDDEEGGGAAGEPYLFTYTNSNITSTPIGIKVTFAR